MANVVRSRSWGQTKPPSGARIEWGHPFAAALRACFLFNEGGGLPVDIAIGGPAAVTANTGGVPRVGSGLRFTNGTAQWVQKQLVPLVGAGNVYSTPWTVDCLVHVYGTTRGGFITYGGLDAAGASVGIGGTTFDGTGTNLISLDMGRAWHATTTPVPTDGSAVHVVMTNSPPSTVTIYMNGLLITSWSSLSAGTADSIFQIGNEDHSTGRSPTCTIDTARLWNRTFTIGDVAALRADPYAFIAAPGPKIFYIGFGTSSTIAKTGAAYASAGTVMVDSGRKATTGATLAENGATVRDTSTKAALGQATAEAGATARDTATKATTGATLASAGATARTTAKKGGVGATVAGLGASAATTAKKTIVGAVRWALGLVGYGHQAVIVRDIDYHVTDAPTAWRAGDVDTAWEAADAPTAWKAGDA